MSHAPKKRFGQHFLRNMHILSEIVELSGIRPGDSVLEIGAGEGTLTRCLLDAGARVTALELDRDLIPGLHDLAREHDDLSIIEGDALDFDTTSLPRPTKFVSNLPYQVASAILSEYCRWPERFPLMVVMVQREVGKRLTAKPGGKDYGTLTLWIGHRYEAEICRIVPPGAFHPPPKVDSALVRLCARREPRAKVDDEEGYFRLIRAAFAQRRKTLLNNLKNFTPEGVSQEKDPPAWADLIAQAGIDPGRRAETLGAEDFARLWQAISK